MVSFNTIIEVLPIRLCGMASAFAFTIGTASLAFGQAAPMPVSPMPTVWTPNLTISQKTNSSSLPQQMRLEGTADPNFLNPDKKTPGVRINNPVSQSQTFPQPQKDAAKWILLNCAKSDTCETQIGACEVTMSPGTKDGTACVCDSANGWQSGKFKNKKCSDPSGG